MARRVFMVERSFWWYVAGRLSLEENWSMLQLQDLDTEFVLIPI
jgi:hypothetical protein